MDAAELCTVSSTRAILCTPARRGVHMSCGSHRIAVPAKSTGIYFVSYFLNFSQEVLGGGGGGKEGVVIPVVPKSVLVKMSHTRRSNASETATRWCAHVFVHNSREVCPTMVAQQSIQKRRPSIQCRSNFCYNPCGVGGSGKKRSQVTASHSRRKSIHSWVGKHEKKGVVKPLPVLSG